nr:hypothetical protein [Tanacetum cinerariifolium]
PFNKKTTFTNNNVPQKVNTVRSNVNIARPKAVVNAVQGNIVNAVKASACWVWKSKTKVINYVSKHNSASITLKKFDYIDAQGRFKSVKNINEETQLHAKVDGKKVVISEASIRRDLQFGDKGGIDYLPNEKVLDLEDELKRTKTAQQTKIAGLERRVKKLKKKHRSRTHTLKRLYKVGLTAKVISSTNDEALNKEDTSKQGRIDKIDADEDISLVSTHDDVNTQDNIVQDKGIEDVVSTAKTIVTTAPTITAESIKTNVEVTQAPKRKGVMILEPEETKTIKIASLQQPQVRDKGKGKAKLIEEPKMLPRERERERESTQKKQEENDALINIWDDIQAKIDANSQLAQRLHKEKQLQLTDAEKAKLFIKFMEKRRKLFAAKRTEEKRNISPTKAQQRSLMCTYLKNIDGWKPKTLKNKSFAKIQELFYKAMKRINTFVDFRTELVEESSKKVKAEITQEESSKRAGDELEQDNTKKQKMEDDKESAELKKCLEILPNDEDDAPPSPDYVPGLEHPPIPEFVSEPVYPKFIPSKDEVFLTEEQPLPAAVSPTTDSPGYIADSDLKEDEEDPEEDPVNYLSYKGDDDDESSDDDEDDDYDVEEDEDEDKEEEEHPALADSILLLVHHVTAKISVQAQTPISLPSEIEVARLLAIPTLPLSPLSLWSSPLPHILSPPLHISPPPLPASPTYSLGYKAIMIRLRAEAPSTFHPLPLSTPPLGTPPLLPIHLPTSSPPLLLPSTSHRVDVPEVTLPPQKRLCIALGLRFEVRESLYAPTARPTRGFRADYRFIDTLNDEIRHDTVEIYVRLDDTQDDRLLMSNQLNMLRRDRRAHARTARLMESEARLSHEA